MNDWSKHRIQSYQSICVHLFLYLFCGDTPFPEGFQMSVSEKISFDQTELLRFITAGSVDDGKSTLIGRLLHDSKSIFEDQLSSITSTTRKRGMEGVDLSLLTDGLQAEREQGITIDVAYRYFATPKRKFIIADTPGHEQYTRNMVTGCFHCKSGDYFDRRA
jgi:translation elongation factor EF-Tu-like GTPase